MTQLTVPAWSSTLGISKQAGYKAVERCRIPVVDGKVDADVATLLYRRDTRSRARSSVDQKRALPPDETAPPGTTPTGSFDDSRRRREAAEASIAELKEAELRGELVREAEVERAIASRLVALRESLEVLADRLSALVAAESDAKICRLLLRDEHRKALATFTEQLLAVEEAVDGGA